MQVDDVRMAGKGRRVIRLAFWLAASLVSLSPVWQPVRAAEGDASTPFQVAAINPAMPAPLARTRFVIQLERAVEFQVSALADPNRVIVELPDVKMLLPAQMDEKATGLVKSFRGGLSAPGRSRIVIDVAAPVVVERAALDKDGKMHRLVLEIAPVEPSDPKQPPKIQLSGLGAGQLQPPTPRRAQRPADKAAGTFKPVIIIDPGHGGDDSGAVKNGIVEKDAVLAFGKALRDKLNATGLYKVFMTRDTDVFVPLDERREFAEEHKAHLFIAVHADYAQSNARGATIYSLTDSTANALRRSAKSEVTGDVLSGDQVNAVQKAAGDPGAVRSILADLAQREVAVTQERTSVFARSVIEFMGNSTSMRENADREANFRVLKTAKVPAVLIELAYVTNSQDAQNLKSQSWRDKVSDSIATAIDNYFSHQIARLPM